MNSENTLLPLLMLVLIVLMAYINRDKIFPSETTPTDNLVYIAPGAPSPWWGWGGGGRPWRGGGGWRRGPGHRRPGHRRPGHRRP